MSPSDTFWNGPAPGAEPSEAPAPKARRGAQRAAAAIAAAADSKSGVGADEENAPPFPLVAETPFSTEVFERARRGGKHDADEYVHEPPSWAAPLGPRRGFGRRAAAFMVLRRYKEAVESYEAALDLDPDCQALKDGLLQALKESAREERPRRRSRN